MLMTVRKEVSREAIKLHTNITWSIYDNKITHWTLKTTQPSTLRDTTKHYIFRRNTNHHPSTMVYSATPHSALNQINANIYKSSHTVWTNQRMQQWNQIMLDLKLVNLARHTKPSYKSKDAKQHISKILIKSRNAKLSQTLVKHETYSKVNIVSHNAPCSTTYLYFVHKCNISC